MRQARLATMLLCVLALSGAGCLKLRRPVPPDQPEYMDTGDRYGALPVQESSVPSATFVVDGKPFCFTGTNNYYLTYKSPRMVDDVFAQARAMDLKLIRVWAFTDRGSPDGAVPSVDGDGTKDGVWFQHWDATAGKPAYNDGPDGLQRLDYVLHKARESGIKLMLVLTNNWTDFGGMDQYLAWYGLEQHHQFYTDERVRQAYRDWVRHLVERKNSIDGVRYGDDPAIFAWELANEPRCKNSGARDAPDGWTTATLTTWADEMSRFVKSIDPNHLVAVGDEGVLPVDGPGRSSLREPECVDHAALLALPAVDFGTFHLYPESYGAGYQFGFKWIEDHLAIAQRLGKPTILEEYGIPVKRDERTKQVSHLWQRREAAYRNWNTLMLRRGGNATLFWMLAGVDDEHGTVPDYDHYTAYAGAETARLLHEYARRFNTEAAACKLAGKWLGPQAASPFVQVRTPR